MHSKISIFNFPELCLLLDLRLTVNLMILIESGNRLSQWHATPKIIYFHPIQRCCCCWTKPPRRASLEIANFIFRHEIQLRGTHSENFSDYWSNCDDNNIGSYFVQGTAGGGLEVREGHVDERVRPHLEVKPTFHLQLHFPFYILHLIRVRPHLEVKSTFQIQLHFTFDSYSAFAAAWSS